LALKSQMNSTHVLGAVFDEELALKAQEILIDRGVKVEVGSGVKELCGNGKVTSVMLQNGTEVEADAVILSMGYKPNVELAEEAGIDINELGFIKVDQYLRTGTPDIFAIGDCAEKRDFITNKIIGAMLASTACAEARVTGMNLYILLPRLASIPLVSPASQKTLPGKKGLILSLPALKA